MDFSSVCRTCLDTKYLNPIFKAGADHNLYSNALFITTGLKMERNDGLPQKMCRNCIKLLNNSLKFREQSKEAEIQLLALKNHGKVNSSSTEYLKEYSKTHVKRKGLKDSSKEHSINVKIERESSENDDEIPLKNLLKNITDTKCQSIKTETKYMQIETEIEQAVENEFIHSDFNEPNKYSNASDDLKYETEFLDPHFDCEIAGDQESKDTVSTTVANESSLNVVVNTENIPFIIHDTNRVTCKLCQKELSRRSIDLHMTKRHPGADTRKVKCDLCDTYVLKQRMNRHKILMHGKDCFRCGYCKMEYDSKNVLLDHVQTCTAKTKRRRTSETAKRKELMVECDICHKMMQKASLKMHKNIKHAGMGPVCEHCGRRLGNKFRLSEHLRAKHGYDKFKCSQCDFLSASVMGIRNHERRHRGEKPFVCESCGAKFHARHLLAQHGYSHRTEKTMKCDLCPAAFKANNTLHMHKLTCHNSHTYQCTMCPRTYRCRPYAVKHLRNVHRYFGPVGNLRKSETHRAPEGSGAEGGIGVAGEIGLQVESGNGGLEVGVGSVGGGIGVGGVLGVGGETGVDRELGVGRGLGVAAESEHPNIVAIVKRLGT